MEFGWSGLYVQTAFLFSLVEKETVELSNYISVLGIVHKRSWKIKYLLWVKYSSIRQIYQESSRTIFFLNNTFDFIY